MLHIVSTKSFPSFNSGWKTALLLLAMGITASIEAAERTTRTGPITAADQFLLISSRSIDHQVQREPIASGLGYPTGDNHAYLFNPIVVDNVMFVLARNSSLVALDASTGKGAWIHENLAGLTSRGIAYWESKNRQDRRFIFAMND